MSGSGKMTPGTEGDDQAMHRARDPDPDAALTPDERAMAERLSRAAPRGGPSAALDASILAAARDAVHPATHVSAPTSMDRPSARQHRRPRWPAFAGVAATLVVAVGIAWQLRPVDRLDTTYSEAPRASRALKASGPSAAEDDAADMAQEAEQSSASAPLADDAPERPEKAGAVSEPAQKPEADATPAQLPPDGMREAPPASSGIVDTPSPMDTPAPPPASPIPLPPPAPPSPPAPPTRAPSPAPVASAPMHDAAVGQAGSAASVRSAASAITSQDRGDDRAADQYRAAREGRSADAAAETERARADGNANVQRSPASDTKQKTSNLARDAATERDAFGDQPLDDQPPASANSPQVQQAWLQRVRDLLREGDRDAARDSLREYQRRYPDAVLPQDLRALLVE